MRYTLLGGCGVSLAYRVQAPGVLDPKVRQKGLPSYLPRGKKIQYVTTSRLHSGFIAPFLLGAAGTA